MALRTLLAARHCGIKLIHMSCFANNSRAQQLARKFDAEMTFDFGSVVGEVEVDTPLPKPHTHAAGIDG
jgi:hypothetical protein